ncbi:MAG: hypothetical protein DMG91_13330 [Acidobacteria bacterium]|jgi:hypothetical protein|nr:MAG: hypothetical protein DMG91_13330 [Acidobacteriota bacterium]
MDVPKLLAVSEGTSVALIAGTWYWVSRQGNVYANWRNKASFVALVLASVAVAVQFVLAIFTQFRSLDALDTASLQGGGNVVVAHLWLWSFFAAGLLSFAGLVLAILGKGSPRLPAGVWSCIVLGMFIINLVLAVNSFH